MLCKCHKLLNILVLITVIIGLLSHFIESNNHKYWKCMEITALRWMWKLLYCFLLLLLWLHFIYWLDWYVLPFKCKVSTDTRKIYFSCITKYLHLLPPLENKGHCHKQRTLVHVKDIRQWLECVPNHTSGPSRYCTHQSNSLEKLVHTKRYVNIGYYIGRYCCTYTEHHNGDEVEATSFTTFEKVAGSFLTKLARFIYLICNTLFLYFCRMSTLSNACWRSYRLAS